MGDSCNFFSKRLDKPGKRCYNEAILKKGAHQMTSEYWEAHESEWLAEQEYLLWVAENGEE